MTEETVEQRLARTAHVTIFPPRLELEVRDTKSTVDGYPKHLNEANSGAAKRPKPESLPRSSEARPVWLPALENAADFMATFKAPDYVVDGIIQTGRLYSLVSPTGHGKTAVTIYLACLVAMGRNIGNIEVTPGEVIILAGENPEDTKGRLHAACRFYGIDPNSLPLRVMSGNFRLTPDATELLRQTIDAACRPPILIIVDTAAAFFHGEDDNDNVQQGAFARSLRVLTRCIGNPAVIVPGHPIKNAAQDRLLPRGGSAYLNEMDANLTLWLHEGVTKLHWLGKIRGADFLPVYFSLHQVTIPHLYDSKGRPFVSIVASLKNVEIAKTAGQRERSEEEIVLNQLSQFPGISIRKIASNARWVSHPDPARPGNTTVNSSKVQRLLNKLERDKLVKKHRKKWGITDAGMAELRLRS